MALRRTSLKRRELRPDDIAVQVDYCGVCHTDLHALHVNSSKDCPHSSPPSRYCRS
nr:alcohol dehydrogenase catalytic domain-containing protein [Spongiactinospora gelatinilytica]